MGSIKKLKGVAENVVSHSVSGLSGLVRQVLARCAETDCQTFSVDLLEIDTFQDTNLESDQLVRAVSYVRGSFASILAKNGGDLRDIHTASLKFVILGDLGKEWPRFTCESVIVTKTKRTFSYIFDSVCWGDPHRCGPLEELQKKMRDTWVRKGRPEA